MNSHVLNLLAVWNRRPKHALEFGVEDDWTYAVELMTAVKTVIPDIQAVLDSVDSRAAAQAALSRNPVSGVTQAENASDASTGILERNEPWKPRWEREDVTNPILATVDPVFSTPNNVEPSAPEEEASNHIPTSTQHTDGTGASSDRTPGTSDTPSHVDARLVAARRVAAKSKAPSSPKRARKKTKRVASVLP